MIIGISDEGSILGLSEQQINQMNQLISNTANENIKLPIYSFTEIININEQRLIVLNIRQGERKRYQTSKGIYLIKSGSDKRCMSSEELRRFYSVLTSICR